MSHLLNIIEKANFNKSLLIVIDQLKNENVKVRIRKNQVLINSTNDSRLIYDKAEEKWLRIEKNQNELINNFKLLSNKVSKIKEADKLKINSNISLKEKRLPLNYLLTTDEIQFSVKKNKYRFLTKNMY